MIRIDEQVDLRDGTNITSGVVLCWSGLYQFKDAREDAEISIDVVDETTDKITINGVDLTGKIKSGTVISIKDSTGNDGQYTVNTCTENAGNTEIVVNEDITDGTDGGTLVYPDFEYVLEVGVIGFASEEFANKSNCNASFGLKLDSEGTKPIDKRYKFDITIAEYESSGNANTLADNKMKAKLEADGYTPSNVVII